MQARAFLLILVNIFLVAIVAHAELIPGPTPSNEGDLGIVIVASHTPEYIKEWLDTPASHGVTIKRITTTKPDLLIVTAFLVTGFSPDTEGNFQFTVSFTLIGPDDKEVFGQKNYATGKGKAPNMQTFVMADPALDIVLERSDPAGVYTIIGTVEDEVSKKSARSECKIKFSK